MQWVEIDARLTRDGHCVLSHDANLTRTAGQDWQIGGTTLAQLSSVEVGGWFDLQYAGEPLPTLGQALDLAAELGLSVNIEMKRTPGRQLAAIDAVAATVAGLDLSPDRLLLSSFDDRLLAAALARLPHLRRALIATQLPSDWRGLAKSLECYSLHCRHDRLTPGEAQAVQGRRLRPRRLYGQRSEGGATPVGHGRGLHHHRRSGSGSGGIEQHPTGWNRLRRSNRRVKLL